MQSWWICIFWIWKIFHWRYFSKWSYVMQPFYCLLSRMNINFLLISFFTITLWSNLFIPSSKLTLFMYLHLQLYLYCMHVDGVGMISICSILLTFHMLSDIKEMSYYTLFINFNISNWYINTILYFLYSFCTSAYLFTFTHIFEIQYSTFWPSRIMCSYIQHFLGTFKKSTCCFIMSAI